MNTYGGIKLFIYGHALGLAVIAGLPIMIKTA
jgi:hypothetical protein